MNGMWLSRFNAGKISPTGLRMVLQARMQGMLGGSCESACQARQCRRLIRKAPGTEMAAHELETERARNLSRNVDDPRQGGRRGSSYGSAPGGRAEPVQPEPDLRTVAPSGPTRPKSCG